MSKKSGRPRVPASGARGRPYQELVAEVARAFDKGATVSEGEWIRGPDGRLDMDVSVRGIIDGRDVLAVIECKDFRAGSTGRVGRAYVDALDSKRHDLNADFAVICSNSGFTKDALRKAKRKGIGMISVLRTGDRRVKVVIEEQIYLRRVTFTGWAFTYHGIDKKIEAISPAHHQFRFKGYSADDWLQRRAYYIAFANPTVENVRATFTFKYPLTFQAISADVVLLALTVIFSYKTQWLAQTVQLDASMGIYDYLRGRLRVGSESSKYRVKGINFDTAEAVPTPSPLPPLSKFQRTEGLLPGELDLAIVLCEGLPTQDQKEFAPLEEHVLPNDLKFSLTDGPLSDNRHEPEILCEISGSVPGRFLGIWTAQLRYSP